MPSQVLDLVNADRDCPTLKGGRQYAVRFTADVTAQIEILAAQNYAKPTQLVRVLVGEGLKSLAAAQD